MKIWTDKKYPIILSCAKCLSPWVEKEVTELGYRPIDIQDNVVVVEGNMRDVFKLNLRLRTAHRVLVPLTRSLAFLNHAVTKSSSPSNFCFAPKTAAISDFCSGEVHIPPRNGGLPKM